MAKRRFFVLLLVLALVVGHAYTLLQLTHGTFTSPDANGYFAQATLMARHGTTELEPESPLGYIGMHWLESEDGRFFSRYPPGVGVLVAIPYKLFGPEAGILVMPILASLTLLFLFLLCRPYTGDWLAALATLLFAVYPTAATHALNWGAHTAVTFFLVAGLYLVDSWSRSPAWWKVCLGGLLLGIVPTMRYAEVVAGAGVAIFLIYHVIRRRQYASHLLLAFVAAAIPVGLLMWRNYSAFGSPFDTGYALTGEQQSGTGFRWEFFVDKWRPYLTGLMGNGMGFFFALGIAGLVGMFARRITLPVAILLTLTIFPISIVYATYYWGGNMMDSGLRFLLPTIPLYLLPAFWLVKEFATKRAVQLGVGFLVLAQLGFWAPTAWDRAMDESRKAERMAVALGFLKERVPEGSVLITDRRLAETLMYYPDWTLLDAAVVGSASRGGGFRRGAFGGGMGRGFGGFGRGGFGRGPADRQDAESEAPSRASPMQRDKAREFRSPYYDIADRQERGELIADDLYALAKAGRQVFWIGQGRQVESFEEFLWEGDAFEKIAEVKLPEAPQRRGGRRGRRGRRGFNPGRGLNADRIRRAAGAMFGPSAGQRLELFKLAYVEPAKTEKTETSEKTSPASPADASSEKPKSAEVKNRKDGDR